MQIEAQVFARGNNEIANLKPIYYIESKQAECFIFNGKKQKKNKLLYLFMIDTITFVKSSPGFNFDNSIGS